MKSVPLKGSPPMPTQRVCPRPTMVVWWTASYVRVPDLETTPMQPGWWMWPGMMPILQAPGAMMPGQLGPMRLDSFHGLLHSVKDRQVEVHGASLACSHSSNHICAVFNGLLGVEGSLLSGETLTNDLALLGKQHVWSSLSVAATDSIFAASGEVPGEGSDGGGHSPM